MSELFIDKIGGKLSSDSFPVAETESFKSSATVVSDKDFYSMLDSEQTVFKHLIIEGDITILSGSGIAFENVQFNGNITVSEKACDTVFSSCRFVSLNNRGVDTYVINSCVPFTDVGINNSGKGLYISNCRFEGIGNAIFSNGSNLEVRSSTIITDADGIGVLIENAENALVALSKFQGAMKSIVMNGAFNSVAVQNSLASVYASGCKNIYICDNLLEYRLHAENNNYFIADGNIYSENSSNHDAYLDNNDNINGDNITDVNERIDAGANEKLIPHVNKDQFVGMERRQTVKEFDSVSAKSVYEYIDQEAQASNCVVVAPGAYTTTSRIDISKKHSDTVIYAYGVYVEAISDEAYYKDNHLRISGAANVAVKGISLGYKQQSCGQVFVLEKPDKTTLTVITAAGMQSSYFCRTRISILRAGTFYALGDFYVTSVTDNNDGTLTVVAPEDLCSFIHEGDILTCSHPQGSHSVPTSANRNISFTDVVLYGYAGGMAFTEIGSETGNIYTRVCITTRSGEIIDKETYEKYQVLQSKYGVDLEISVEKRADGTLRYRGSPARICSRDATHVKRNAQGSQLYSCLFENMCDDGTNQNSNHGRLSEVIYNENGTATVVYKGSMAEHFYLTDPSASFSGFCAQFREGDRVFIYTSNGQLVCDSPALSPTVSYPSIKSTHPDFPDREITRYAVTVSADAINKNALKEFDLTDDSHLPTQKVLIDNMSLSSNGFHFENTVIRDVRSNGMRIKASNGVVKNCTFRNFPATAMAIIYELRWGESGISENIKIENNIIDNTGFSNIAPSLDDLTVDYCKCPITIMGLGDGSLDPDYLLYKNILISGNKFINRCLDNYNYAIYARAVCGLTLKNNDFGTSADENGVDKVCNALYLSGAVDVEVSDNKYAPSITGKPSEYVHGDRYRHVFGTDVEKDGVSLVSDKLQ